MHPSPTLPSTLCRILIFIGHGQLNHSIHSFKLFSFSLEKNRTFGNNPLQKTCALAGNYITSVFLYSGYSTDDIRDCIEWMQPIVSVLHDEPDAVLRPLTKIAENDWHNIQQHNVYMTLLVSFSGG